jgi:hypothetical protein
VLHAVRVMQLPAQVKRNTRTSERGDADRDRPRSSGTECEQRTAGRRKSSLSVQTEGGPGHTDRHEPLTRRRSDAAPVPRVPEARAPRRARVSVLRSHARARVGTRRAEDHAAEDACVDVHAHRRRVAPRRDRLRWDCGGLGGREPGRCTKGRNHTRRERDEGRDATSRGGPRRV